MGWQEDLKLLGEQLTSGEITTAEYRERSDSVLAEADREAAELAAAETQPTEPPERPKPHIPVSAAWEAPSGEMTQIVGTQDKTTLVTNTIADKLDRPGT
jgi:hypothetical protein